MNLIFYIILYQCTDLFSLDLQLFFLMWFFLMWNLQRVMRFLVLCCCFFLFYSLYIFWYIFSILSRCQKKSNNIAIRRNCTIFTCPKCEAKRTSHILRKKIAIKYHLYKGVFDDIQISLLWPPWQVGICDNHYNICSTSWNCSSNCGSGTDSSR